MAALTLTDSEPELSYAAYFEDPLKRRLVRAVERLSGQPKIKQLYDHYRADLSRDVPFFEAAIRLLEGRWKLLILFQLFGGQVKRFSDLERAIPAVSQKMLIQQLRQLEADGIVTRRVHHQVPPKVEYGLTEWGQALCPALDALLAWAGRRDGVPGHP